MDISVIVPVYNVEKYLVRCLDSIFNQKFSGTFEVITVDDASTDNSLQILYTYQNNENRLHVIAHDTNKKTSLARSTGMNASRGDYVMHVDADDWLMPNALEKLFLICRETDADVVVFDIIKEDSKGNKSFLNSIENECMTTDKLKVQKHFFGALVTKIAKRKLVENMISGTIGVNSTEDLLYSFELLLKARTIYLLPEYCYVYFTNSESLTNTLQPEKYIQNQVIILSQIQLIVEKYRANLQITENVLNYYEKWLYLRIAQIQFKNQSSPDMYLDIISSFRNSPIMSQSRVNRLELATTNRNLCLIEVAKRFRIKTAMGIIYRSLRKKT